MDIPDIEPDPDIPVHSDAHGYYRALRLTPEATRREIQLAYEMLTEVSDEERGATRAQVERAYAILVKPSSRKDYDRICTSTGRAVATRRPLDDWRVLAACFVLLVGILGFVWVPLYGDRLKSFDPGDRLIDRKGAPFGVVVEIADAHPFPSGVTTAGILIDLSDGTGPRWFPASDIRAICRKAR